MPRVHIERVAFCALCAACGSAEQAAVPTTRDDNSATIGEQSDPDADAGSSTAYDPSGDAEPSVLFCQSQFYGADPLSSEETPRSCSHTLRVSVLNPANVSVKVGDRFRTPGDSEDGWQLEPDAMTVVLLGAACEDVLGGANLELSALCED